MNINSPQEAIRERDEAREELAAFRAGRDLDDSRSDSVRAQLSEAVALLRRMLEAWDEPSPVSVGLRCDAIVAIRAFLARLDGAK